MSYLNSFGSSVSNKLEVVEFSISNTDFLNLRSIELKGGTQVAEDFLNKHSTLYGEGVPHNYDYIKAPTNVFEDQHYFSSDIFNKIKVN